MEILFPHEKIRETQDEFINDILSILKNKQHLLAHAPTGIGKSAAVLSTTVPFAIKNNLTIFFLTSRHTQHKIAVETLKEIKLKHNPALKVTDLIGKKHMCPVPGTDTLTTSQFSEYCKEVVDKGTCQLYNNTKNNSKLSVTASNLLSEISSKILDVDELKTLANNSKLCPYEIALLKAKNSNVIIMDYYHIFSPSVSQFFLKRTEKLLQESIIIIDEAHNLPQRMLEHLSSKITLTILKRAIKEANYHQESLNYLREIQDSLVNLTKNLEEEEKLIQKQDFNFDNYKEIISTLEPIADEIRKTEKHSYIGSVIEFLKAWQGQDEGFARILSKSTINENEIISLSYCCLDPSLLSTEVIDSAYCTISMSGTLTPLKMYSDLLGFKAPILKEYPNPFPQKNRLNLLVPKTSTKFTKRSMGMYQEIAKEISSIVNEVPGNVIVFFPSYNLRDSIDVFFRNLCKKTTYHEQKGISKQEKEMLLENFKEDKEKGAVLLAVLSGNFNEGIDLPGDLLKAVIVVGLPLSRPNLQTTELINYYDKKFSKGWDYAYIFPAMRKTIQAAGRCIRSETDKGIIVFLDERYSWNNYFKCFPLDLNIKITKLPLERIKEFFK